MISLNLGGLAKFNLTPNKHVWCIIESNRASHVLYGTILWKIVWVVCWNGGVGEDVDLVSNWDAITDADASGFEDFFLFAFNVDFNWFSLVMPKSFSLFKLMLVTLLSCVSVLLSLVLFLPLLRLKILKNFWSLLFTLVLAVCFRFLIVSKFELDVERFELKM